MPNRDNDNAGQITFHAPGGTGKWSIDDVRELSERFESEVLSNLTDPRQREIARDYHQCGLGMLGYIQSQQGQRQSATTGSGAGSSGSSSGGQQRA